MENEFEKVNSRNEGSEEPKEPKEPKEQGANLEFSQTETERTEAKLEGLEGEKDSEKEIQEAREQIEKSFIEKTEKRKKERKPLTENEIKIYQEKYIPEHLKKKKESGRFLSKILNFIIGRRFEKEGEENFPEKGPFLVACNHFEGNTGALLAVLKNCDAHIAASRKFHWEKQKPFRPWLLRKLGMIAVDESLSNLSEEEKAQLLERVPKGFAREKIQEICEREEKGNIPTNIDFVHQSVALLSRGDVVAIFPEGLWLFEEGEKVRREDKLYKGYRGVEIVNSQYKKITGRELPIVPIAIYKEEGQKKGKISIGKPFEMSDNETDLSDTDWCMSHVAQLLPEDKRGYYGKESENI